MTGLTADQIIERLTNANGSTPDAMLSIIEQTIQKVLADPNRPRTELLEKLYPNKVPNLEELIVALEDDLYNELMPKFPGWQWDGNGYVNLKLYGEEDLQFP